MNIREFCREPGYPSTLILTWSFDAVFFERVLLQDLAAGGSRAPLILADRHAIASAKDHWPGRVQHLGRRYVLESTRHEGHFHPKVLIRVGPKGGLVWLSTGNLSSAGLGGNRELGTTWKVGPEAEDPGGWLRALLVDVGGWCASPAAKELVHRLQGVAWLNQPTARTTDLPPVLWSRPGATLAQQLEARWKGRCFDTVALMTGSTDASGAFLAWAHETFGVKEARIAVNAGRASFDPSLIEKLPLATGFIEPGGPRPLHAKCYWFRGPEGEAALVGSANCSASAWVRPVDTGGNLEMMAVFDHPIRAEWEQVLSLFEMDVVAPHDHLLVRQLVPPEPEGSPSYAALFLEMDMDDGRVRAATAPVAPPESSVVLMIEGEQVQMKWGDASLWEGPLPECSGSMHALFGALEITTAAGRSVTPLRWVDKRHELREAARDQRALSILGRYSRPMEAKEERRMMEDLQLALTTLLTEPGEFQDAPGPRRTIQAKESTKPLRRLDPDQMAAALRRGGSAAARTGDELQRSLTFQGVMSAFFAPAEAEGPAGPEDAAGLRSQEGGGPSPAPDLPDPPPPYRPKAPNKVRLANQVDTFLTRLLEPKFAESCTARQLVQAVGLPIALATLGAESGWAAPEVTRTWALKAVAALLFTPIEGTVHRGLLACVAERYGKDGRSEVFEQEVGNGALWTVAAVALAGQTWPRTAERIQRALLIREVLEHPMLISQADFDTLGRLAGLLRDATAAHAIRSEFPRILEELRQLEVCIDQEIPRLIEEQMRNGGSHRVNDPMRGPLGWGFVVKDARIRAKSKVRVRLWQHGSLSSEKEPYVLSAGHYVNMLMALENGWLKILSSHPEPR